MANKIIIKKSSVASKVPLAADLEVGELAVNLSDQKLYSKNASGTVILVGSGGSGSGDVQGPASATDNALARFDGTTGKVIQNSAGTLDDSGNLDVASAKADFIDLDTAASAPAYAQGRMYWDSGNGTPSVMLDPDVDLQLGQENIAKVYNGTGSTIAAGSVVAVSGAQGQRPAVSLADADSEALSAPTLGIATESIANGSEGFVTTFGFVRGINTSAFTAGQAIYLSQTAGQFTATRPTAPAHTVALGWVIKVNASSGEVFVNISNGWELAELHDVVITSPASGNTLIYDAVAGVWENANLTDGTGINITEGAGAITIANTGVLGVTATSPVASSGGQNPVISISQASTSTNGFLSSTDWNTFNGKQAALVSGTNIKTVNGTSLLGSGDVSVGVTSVGATAPIASSGGATPTISLNDSGVTAGSYTYSSITVDAKGRVTAASSGSAPQSFPSGTRMTFNQTAAPTGWTKDTTASLNDSAFRVVTGTAASGGTVAFSTAFTSQAVSGSISSTTATNQSTTATGSLSSTTATNQATTAGGSLSSTTATNQATTATGSVSVSVSVGNTTLGTNEMPSHTHTARLYYYDASGPRSWFRGSYPANDSGDSVPTNATGGSGAHGHSGSGSGSFSGNSHNHTQDAHSHTFTGSSHNHTQDAHSHTFTGTAHNHTQDAHSHTFTGTAINLAVKYVDLIIATKD